MRTYLLAGRAGILTPPHLMGRAPEGSLEIISAGTRTRNLWIRSPARSSIAPQRPHREGSVGSRTEKSAAPQGPTPTATSLGWQHLQRPLLPQGHGRNNPGDDPYLARQQGCSKNLDAGWFPPLWQPFRSIPGARRRAELNPGAEFIAASPSASSAQHPPLVGFLSASCQSRA